MGLLFNGNEFQFHKIDLLYYNNMNLLLNITELYSKMVKKVNVMCILFF